MCLVCGADETEFHFGGKCCRACAAFFRRYFHSKKTFEKCRCEKRMSNSHPCRKCRVEKCLSLGMSPDKIQKNRDKNRDKENVNEKCQMVPCSSQKLTLPTRIISKDTSNISFAIPNWKSFIEHRNLSANGDVFKLNIYELTSLTKSDITLARKMVDNMFSFVRELEEMDKNSLLKNFYLKLWMLIPIMDCIENEVSYESMKKEDYENFIVNFYGGAFTEGKEMPENEILRIFEPFWWTYYNKTVPPIVGLKLEKKEIMAILWLLFFDNGYTNISLECQEMCRNVRKVIYRELKNYQNDRKFDDKRFFETVGALEIIEKGEIKAVEKIMICEMHNIKIHDDFKAILKENKL